MHQRSLTIPELLLIAGTRVALGVGVGLLISEKLTGDQRRAAGITLFAVGALTTVPLIMNVFQKETISDVQRAA
jgi:hypothetical protein